MIFQTVDLQPNLVAFSARHPLHPKGPPNTSSAARAAIRLQLATGIEWRPDSLIGVSDGRPVGSMMRGSELIDHHTTRLWNVRARAGQEATATAELPDCRRVHPTYHAAPPVRPQLRLPAQDTIASGLRLDGRLRSS